MSAPFVSIVIPVLNDAASLSRLLPSLPTGPEAEIIVVNGGAQDSRLAALVEDHRGILLSSRAGRGRQMNVGALHGRGRWFVFLHADTHLPEAWFDEIRHADSDGSIVGGSFRFRLESEAWQARVIERFVRWRMRWLDLAYGDQALFVRRDAFHALGGYREWPLMEDVDLIRRLRRIGRLHHSSLAAVTSARRWERDGWWRRSAQNVLLQVLFFSGISPLWLAKRYLPHADTRAHREALVVMARAPSDTRGKSRLLRDIAGDHLELRRGILLDTLDVAARCRRADMFVAFEPADALSEFERLSAGAATLIAQCGDTLGDRMHNVFAHLFASGYASVVMIGSDLPTLPSSYIEQAFERLRHRPNAVAIGPATDGGYYLIGLRVLSSELFASIPWSTSDVLASTLRAAKKLGLSVSLTPEWYDVDDVNDLRRALHEEAGAARTRAWAATYMDPHDVAESRSVRSDSAH